MSMNFEQNNQGFRSVRGDGEKVKGLKYCCNECKNKNCPANHKNAPKSGRVQFAALCGSKQCKGYKKP